MLMLLISDTLTSNLSRVMLIYTLKNCMKNGRPPFHSCVRVINENDQPCTSPLGNILSKLDICNYLGGQMYLAARLTFVPNTYKPPSSNDEITSKYSESCNGWTDLQRDLSIAAHDAGNPIISNGSNNPLEEKQTIICFNVEYFINITEPGMDCFKLNCKVQHILMLMILCSQLVY